MWSANSCDLEALIPEAVVGTDGDQSPERLLETWDNRSGHYSRPGFTGAVKAQFPAEDPGEGQRE
jgi:hypothetical protein